MKLPEAEKHNSMLRRELRNCLNPILSSVTLIQLIILFEEIVIAV